MKEKIWPKLGTAAQVALEEVVYNKKPLKDLKLVTEFHHIGTQLARERSHNVFGT